jgi:hypothetical protein
VTVSDYLSYQGVGVSAQAIWESEKRRITLKIPKASVVCCELQRGCPEQRPAVSACLGAALLAPGIVLVQHTLILVHGEGWHIHPRYEAAMLFMAVVGTWLLFRVIFCERFYVRVFTRQGATKLVFGRRAQLPELTDFLRDAEARFGWKIQNSLAE